MRPDESRSEPFSIEAGAGGGDSRRLQATFLIDRVAFGGQGVGRLPGGKVCFVPFTLPGEKVCVRIRRELKTYAEGELTRIVEASPERVKPACPVFGRCGGCQYQHATYPRQLAMKRDQVVDALRRIGGFPDPPVAETLASPHEFHYRNRITVHAKDGKIGFYGPKSRSLIEVATCPIASVPVNTQLTTLLADKPQDGEYTLREPSPFRGFRQVNDAVAAQLLDVTAEMLEPGGPLVVDAYCGAGFFAKRLRKHFEMVIGIEWSSDAVRAARAGAGAGEIYLLGDVKRHLPAALKAAPPADTAVILDPPAEGCDSVIIDLLRERAPRRIVYVSCNPSTLARDLKRLGSGFRLDRVVPIDMFPQTAEIESATLLIHP